MPTRSTHRYLDIMTVRPSQAARPTSPMQNRPFTTQLTYTVPDASYTGSNQMNASVLSANIIGPFSSSSSSAPIPPRTPSIGTASSRRLNITGSIAANQHSTMNSTVLSSSKPESTPHANLLIEPILLPNMQHVHVDSQQDLEESCLFYPTGHKNKNIRREIENAVVKHHIIENSRMLAARKRKEIYRIVRPDPYANAKGPPLVYTKKKDKEVEQLLGKMRHTEGKIESLVQIRL